MPADRVYHVDGRLVPAESATVSVRDRGFRFGDAAVETCRVYGGRPFEWTAHADRLFASCDTLRLDPPVDADDIRDRVAATLSANALADAVATVTVTRGPASDDPEDDLTPPADADPTVVVTVTPAPRGGRDGDRVWNDPAAVQTVKTRRVSDRAVPANVSLAGDVNRVLARLELRVSDADEALMLDDGGRVVGGADSDLFFVRDDALRTPSLDGSVRPTRAAVLDLASAEGVTVREGRFTPDAVREADEAFLVSPRWEVRPVASVDGLAVGGGPVTDLLAYRFDERVESACYAGDGERNG